MKIGICTLALGLLLATPARAGEVTRTFTGGMVKRLLLLAYLIEIEKTNLAIALQRQLTPTAKPHPRTAPITTLTTATAIAVTTELLLIPTAKVKLNNYSADGQRTRTGGTVTKSGTVTGANGNQGTYNNTRTCNGGECSFNLNTTYPDGKIREVNGTATRTGKGSYSGNVTVTGRNGNMRSGSFTRTRVK